MNYRYRKKLLVFCAIFYIFWRGALCDDLKNSSDLTKNIKNISVVLYSHENVEMLESNYSIVKNEDIDELLFIVSEAIKTLNLNNGFNIIQNVVKNISNDVCARDVSYLLQAITRKERWALEMFDSFPKYPESILYGNFYQLGNFDECVRINRDITNAIKGQYCLVDIHFKRKFIASKPKRPKTENMALEKNRSFFDNNLIHWAICLPSSCSLNDAEMIVRSMFSLTTTEFEVFTENSNLSRCETEKTLPITTGEIIYGVIVGAFFIFIIIATFFHFWFIRYIRKNAVADIDTQRGKQFSMMKETLICFSLIRTTERFLHTKPNELNLEAICGIKFISMVIILAGHSLIFVFGGPTANKNFFVETSTKLEHAMFINSPIIVDTFLLISGFLMCRLLLIELDKRKGKINFLLLYIARYIRLTPAYAVILGFYVTYLPRIGSGPFWHSRIGLEQERCEKTWWLNLLYINNYVGTDNLCMFQSWYLAVDYHLFILAPFVIYPLWKKPKLGEAILFFCFLVSIILPFTITYVENLDPTMMGYPPEVEDLAKNFYFVNYYIKTHMRCSSYCVGLFYAYMVHKIQNNSKKIPTYVNVIGWFFAITCGAASILAVVIFYDPDHTPNITENAFYSALHRVGWSLSIGWTLLVCITNNAGIVNKFLSHKFFVPASRLTYCAYLANGLVEIYSTAIARQPMFMSVFELSYKTCGHILITFGLAFVLCIIFESPIHGMEKILLRDVKKREQKSPQIQTISA